MAYVIETRCCNCQTVAARVDENGWCEQCWLNLHSAYELFGDLEALVVCKSWTRAC